MEAYLWHASSVVLGKGYDYKEAVDTNHFLVNIVLDDIALMIEGHAYRDNAPTVVSVSGTLCRNTAVMCFPSSEINSNKGIIPPYTKGIIFYALGDQEVVKRIKNEGFVLSSLLSIDDLQRRIEAVEYAVSAIKNEYTLRKYAVGAVLVN